jgi:biopolymer transport protein ExbB
MIFLGHVQVMNKRLIFKIAFLVLALATVLMVLIAAMRTDFSVAARGQGRPRTYFEQFFIAGGPIVWFVQLPMSLVTVYLTTVYFLTIRRKKLLPDDSARGVIAIMRQHGFAQLPARLADRNDFVSTAVARAVAQSGGDLNRMRTVLVESLQDQAMCFLRKIEWANIIGNVSPMVGLFGTVLGIIKMFNAMALAGGQPNPAQLAGGISVALVTTFWGLMIAIPAVTIHGLFRNRIEMLVSEAAVEAEKLLPQMVHILRERRRSEQSAAGGPQPIVELPPKSAEAFRTSLLP